ncbi:GTPase IMAP family member 8-like [Parambassis ranga]|uniref:GTPase IMAP family member 8-like n=1 Tax=Parambassis ranga TaxID=210632 RepID=A0A6P7IPY0_9TELE|nr:GTPase IMAP family member 8-like [Parambassis ranga]XP_028267092.1 GTPase IMAP family member 8-like [Parambassis ranga]
MDTHQLTIVLLGNVGVGKSAAGNTILGEKVFVSKASFKSVTTKICESTGTVCGKQISVVDTPGILTCKGEIERWCQDLLQPSTLCLFLVVISIGRFTNEQRKAVEETMSVLKQDGLRRSYILFTNGDALEDMTVDDFINEDDESSLPDIVKEFEGRYHVFNNNDRYEAQVKQLLIKSGHLQPTFSAGSEGSLVQRRIVLLGRPGAGKSSSGNTILGSNRFESDCDFDSVNTETVSKSAEVEGYEVTVVDTPGFTDEVLTPEQLYREIMETLVHANPGPHAFVIVVRIGRVSKTDMDLINLLSQLFGSGARNYTMVLFTYGDELGEASIKEKIRSSQQMSRLVSMCHERYCVFDNRRRKNRQVRDFIDTIEEIVTANVGEYYTSDMFRMAYTFIREAQITGSGGTEAPQQRAQRRLEPFLSGMWRKVKRIFCCCFRPTTSSDDDDDDDDENIPLMAPSHS